MMVTTDDSAALSHVVPIPLDNPSEEEELDRSISHTNRRKRSHYVVSILARVQKYSAFTLSTFVGIHVTSVIIVPILPIDHDIKQQVFEMGRNVYHGIPQFETIVILGASILHVISGITIRVIRSMIKSRSKAVRPKNQLISNNDEINIIDDTRDDIGLGGITNFLGLGYKKSWVSKTFGLSPISFSGYLLIPQLLYHVYKFRLVPMIVDGDSSLINLDFISYYLQVENIKYVQPYVNIAMLSILSYVGVYHVVSGVFKYFKKYSPNWKRIGFAIVNSIGVMGLVVIYKFRFNSNVNLDGNDFFGKNFLKYLTWGYI